MLPASGRHAQPACPVHTPWRQAARHLLRAWWAALSASVRAPYLPLHAPPAQANIRRCLIVGAGSTSGGRPASGEGGRCVIADASHCWRLVGAPTAHTPHSSSPCTSLPTRAPRPLDALDDADLRGVAGHIQPKSILVGTARRYHHCPSSALRHTDPGRLLTPRVAPSSCVYVPSSASSLGSPPSEQLD